MNQRKPVDTNDSQQDLDTTVAIIGSGFSGLGMAIQLRKRGRDDFLILEKSHDIGGAARMSETESTTAADGTRTAAETTSAATAPAAALSERWRWHSAPLPACSGYPEATWRFEAYRVIHNTVLGGSAMTNRYLEAVFAPINEEFTLTDLEVTGTIPTYLDGRYLRNGSNPIGEVDPELYHWFTGDGMVHGIRIRDGRAEWYRNRWVRGPLAATNLGEAPSDGHLGLYDIGANTNVIGHAGKTIALMEGGLANYELSDDLDTVGVCDFDGTLTGGYTAHPKRDPETGELHAVSYRWNRGNTVQYSVIGIDGRARRTVDIEVAGSPLMHDFSLTERHLVFYDLPVTFDAGQAAAMTVPRGLRPPTRLLLSALIGRVRFPDPIAARMPCGKKSYRRLPYSWNPNYPARVGVMPRDGSNGDVRWFDVEPCYVYHPMNAYDNGDTSIVLDVVRHPKMFDTDHRGPNEGPPTLDRWIVDLADGKVRESRVDDRGQEFPRVDERLVGKPHRYGYAPTVGEDATGGDSLIKHDLVGGNTQSRSFGADKTLGEFVFHPSSPDAEEDDGVLMGYLYDRPTDRSELAVLDARTLQDVASVKLPHRVPAGFHGNWIPTLAG